MVNNCQSARYKARFLQSDSKPPSPPPMPPPSDHKCLEYLDVQKDVAELNKLCEQLSG
jgi:hypothetical protein